MSDEPKKKTNWNSNVISALAGMLIAMFVCLVALGADKIDRAQAKDMIDIAMTPILDFQKEIHWHWARDSVWKERLNRKLNIGPQ